MVGNSICNCGVYGESNSKRKERPPPGRRELKHKTPPIKMGFF